MALENQIDQMQFHLMKRCFWMGAEVSNIAKGDYDKIIVTLKEIEAGTLILSNTGDTVAQVAGDSKKIADLLRAGDASQRPLDRELARLLLNYF